MVGHIPSSQLFSKYILQQLSSRCIISDGIFLKLKPLNTLLNPNPITGQLFTYLLLEFKVLSIHLCFEL